MCLPSKLFTQHLSTVKYFPAFTSQKYFELVKTWEAHDFLFYHLLLRKMVDSEVNFSKAILTYLYSPLTYSMPTFTLLLSTTSPCAVVRSAKILQVLCPGR